MRLKNNCVFYQIHEIQPLICLKIKIKITVYLYRESMNIIKQLMRVYLLAPLQISYGSAWSPLYLCIVRSSNNLENMLSLGQISGARRKRSNLWRQIMFRQSRKMINLCDEQSECERRWSFEQRNNRSITTNQVPNKFTSSSRIDTRIYLTVRISWHILTENPQGRSSFRL